MHEMEYFKQQLIINQLLAIGTTLYRLNLMIKMIQ